jgi:hypothetical protein
LAEDWNRPAVFIGGSIPITVELKKALQMGVILAGFALEDNCIHSPGEKYHVPSLHKGMRS